MRVCVREVRQGVGIRMQLSGAYDVLGGFETAEPHPSTPNQQRNVSLEFRGRQKLPLCHKAQLRQHCLSNKQLFTPKGEEIKPQKHSKWESNCVVFVA